MVVWHQVREEFRTSVEDLDRRAGMLVHRNTTAARQALALPDEQVGAALAIGSRATLAFWASRSFAPMVE